MNKNKSFDCVEMKWKIQEKLYKDFMQMPEKEFVAVQRKKLSRNPRLAGFLA